jgi:D-alanyl-D-alanine carboxypeptidase
MQPDDVLRLGSVTKQFTAVAILQLVEAGKIKLDDDITTYVPELQTGGHKITLTHLLNHTSGLPSFTDQPEYPTAKYQAMPLSKMLAMIKDKPAHFAPGADWAYCNTGYWLLGAVIEKVSGQSYGDYVNEHIFQPAGMVHSSYDQTARIVAQRVPGYTAGSDRKPANADFINMTVPQAAGALISNVDDLWKWEQALAAGKLVRPDLLALAYATGHTADGRATGYGFGWTVGNFKGHPVVEHGGGIEGFLTYVLRVNDAGVFVAVLCNSDRPKANPSSIAHQLAALVLGNAAPVATVTVPIEQLRQYVGVYRLNSTRKLGFTVEGGQLILKRPRGEPSAPLQALSPTEFIAPENEVHFTFLPPSPDGGRRLLWHPAVGAEVYAPRVNEPLDDPEKPAVDLAPEILERYVGDYEATPDFVFTVKHVGTSLTLQATGQSVTDLIAESPVRFRDLPPLSKYESAAEMQQNFGFACSV